MTESQRKRSHDNLRYLSRKEWAALLIEHSYNQKNIGAALGVGVHRVHYYVKKLGLIVKPGRSALPPPERILSGQANIMLVHPDSEEYLPTGMSNVVHAQYWPTPRRLVLILATQEFGYVPDGLRQRIEAAQESSALSLVRDLAACIDALGPLTQVYEGDAAAALWGVFQRIATVTLNA